MVTTLKYIVAKIGNIYTNCYNKEMFAISLPNDELKGLDVSCRHQESSFIFTLLNSKHLVTLITTAHRLIYSCCTRRGYCVYIVSPVSITDPCIPLDQIPASGKFRRLRLDKCTMLQVRTALRVRKTLAVLMTTRKSSSRSAKLRFQDL